MMNKYLQILFVCCLCGSSWLIADVRLPAIVGDNMVIQADSPAPIWGWAEPYEKVSVKIGNKTKKTIANVSGKWLVEVGPFKSGTPIITITVSGAHNTIVLKNILVGQVWLGAGQSNMTWTVSKCCDGDSEIRNASYPEIRLFTVGECASPFPVENCSGKWVVCSSETVGEFSGVLYFFGRYLHNSLKEPVGLIHSSWGGTLCEAWVSSQGLDNPKLSSVAEKWNQYKTEYAVKLQEYYNAWGTWSQENDKALSAGLPPVPRPVFPCDAFSGLANNPDAPSSLFNGMIAPIWTYAIKGVIWYQGESNTKQPLLYYDLFPALITDWRKIKGQPQMPFIFAQLASVNNSLNRWPKDSWAEVRNAQTSAIHLPGTAMAVTFDVSDPNDVHYKNKQEVGLRMGLAALAIAYSKEVVCSGPLYKTMTTSKNKVFLSFDYANGLKAKGEKLLGFKVAGKDGIFVDAEASIVGDNIVVSCRDIEYPVAVRYGWCDNPIVCNLYNGYDLPAAPFKTDNDNTFISR